MNTKTQAPTPQAPKPPVLKLERTFNATPERLWTYWMDPKKYAKWLNPSGIDLVVHEWDARVGGKVRFDMPQPDGNKNPQEGVFHELVPHKKIVSGDADKTFLLTVTFTPVDANRTTLTVLAEGVPLDWHAPAREGWGRSFDQLAKLVDAPERALPGGPAVATIQGRSVRLERFFMAPPAKVWAAWATPATLEKWFWPSGKGKIREFTFRAGGRLVMGHESQPWTATWEFVKVEPERRIVLQDVWDDGSGHKATGTIEFVAEAGGTRLVVTHGPFPEKGPYKLEDAVGGFSVVVNNLAKIVEAGAGGPNEGFTIERTFKAKPEKVWAMWTTKEGLMKWWALSAKEVGFDFTVRKLDVRVGGTYAFGMKGNGHDLVNGGTYTTVRPHTKLAWTWHFDIYLQPHEKPYDVPISVELTPTPAGGTRMVFTQGPLAAPEHTEGSRQGVLKNFEKLEEALTAPK